MASDERLAKILLRFLEKVLAIEFRTEEGRLNFAGTTIFFALCFTFGLFGVLPAVIAAIPGFWRDVEYVDWQPWPILLMFVVFLLLCVWVVGRLIKSPSEPK